MICLHRHAGLSILRLHYVAVKRTTRYRGLGVVDWVLRRTRDVLSMHDQSLGRCCGSPTSVRRNMQIRKLHGWPRASQGILQQIIPSVERRHDHSSRWWGSS
jgi:hypothetical protein